MCPLEVLTAMVSAIRVGAPMPWRAIVGRARENRAIAELELMSSTSNEVCELWTELGMVRVMGSPHILEIIYFDEHKNDEPNYGIYTLHGDEKDSVLKRNGKR
jgi:hypothetical protein